MTTKIQEAGNQIQQKARQAASNPEISRAMEVLLRLGFVVRGVIYAVIGLLALQLVLGDGGKLTDSQGAIATIGATPFGGILLYGILAGLISYGLWGLVRAIFDPLHKGTDAKGLIARLGFAVSGFSYLGLGFVTYNLIGGKTSAAQNGAQGAQLQHTAGSILAEPWGAWVVGLIALIMIASGLAQMVQAVRSRFDQQFNGYTLKADQRKLIVKLGRFGSFARGIVIGLVGLFFLLAAYTHNPGQAKGFDGVFAALLQQPYGIWLLGVIAVGLIAFGIYSIMSGVVLRLKRSVQHA